MPLIKVTERQRQVLENVLLNGMFFERYGNRALHQRTLDALRNPVTITKAEAFRYSLAASNILDHPDAVEATFVRCGSPGHRAAMRCEEKIERLSE